MLEKLAVNFVRSSYLTIEVVALWRTCQSYHILVFRYKMQPQILLLKEGTENAQGKQQVISNINACSAIVDAIRNLFALFT